MSAALLDSLSESRMTTPLLEVNDLHVEFDTYGGTVHAVRGVSFNVEPGETLAIVGESGCGKSVTVQSIMGLIPMPPGRITRRPARDCAAHDILRSKQIDGADIRGDEVGMIFQDPMTSLNPTMTIGDQIAETLIVHRGFTQEAGARSRHRTVVRDAHSRRGQTRAAVSVRIFRRHAAALDDRDGDRVRTGHSDRRRTDDRARRDDSGADPRSDEGPAARERHGDHSDHARPRRRRAHGRPRQRDVRRRDRRARHRATISSIVRRTPTRSACAMRCRPAHRAARIGCSPSTAARPICSRRRSAAATSRAVRTRCGSASSERPPLFARRRRPRVALLAAP